MRFIPIKMLKPGMKTGRSIIGRKKEFMLASKSILTEDYISRLAKGGYMGAYILDDFTDGISMESIISDETMQNGIEAVAERNIDDIIKVSATMVEEIKSRGNVRLDLYDLRSFDDYTYHHSVSVAVYAVIVGQEMGYSGEDLELLATAGLCHDLGKSKIPIEVLNKPSRLTDEEFDLIKTHPRSGYEMLYGNPKIPVSVRQAVLCHHENENGTGYPAGLSGDKIHPFAKIIHAVDVYDALTSRRVYKEPNTPSEAMEYLMGGCETLFDRDVVGVMLDAIPSYPPGIEVKLSDGSSGIVMEHTADVLRPKVKLYETSEVVDLSSNEAFQHVYIESSGFLSLSESKVEELNENRGTKQQRKKRAIVAVDSIIDRRQMEAALSEMLDVITITNGYECINYIKEKGGIDVLIIDTDLSEPGGIKTVKTLRNIGFNSIKVPVVFVSHHKDKETILACRDLGAEDYILKPVNPIFLQKRIQLILQEDTSLV